MCRSNIDFLTADLIQLTSNAKIAFSQGIVAYLPKEVPFDSWSVVQTFTEREAGVSDFREMGLSRPIFGNFDENQTRRKQNSNLRIVKSEYFGKNNYIFELSSSQALK